MKTIFINGEEIAHTPKAETLPTGAEVAEKIKDALLGGIAHFAFRKASDGTLREAFGTLNAEYIPRELRANEVQPEERKAGNPNVIKYFDLAAKQWRQFVISKAVALF